MTRKILPIILLLFGLANIYSQTTDPIVENEQETTETEQASAERTIYLPGLSYSLLSFNDIQFHNPSASLRVFRFNPIERDKFLSFSLSYNPQIINGIEHDFPDLYHSAAAFFIYGKKQHLINAGFMARTDKPLYGGLNTFMGMAGYSNNLIKKDHFSMTLGISLVVMDLGVKLNNGTTWMLWPLPIVMLNWEYDWINFSLMPIPRLEIAPKKPVSLTARAGYPDYDVAVWYKNFKEDNPSFEFFAIGAGVKNETNRLMFADGRSYGINYNALYGAVRIFRLFEISGGWTFNGKEGYGERNYEDLSSYAGINVSKLDDKIGQGFFFSVSGRIMF